MAVYFLPTYHDKITLHEMELLRQAALVGAKNFEHDTRAHKSITSANRKIKEVLKRRGYPYSKPIQAGSRAQKGETWQPHSST